MHALPSLSPALQFDPELLLRAQDVRVAFFDVDGVLTDGSLYLGDDGQEYKAFHSRDGHGMKMLQAAGVIELVAGGASPDAVGHSGAPGRDERRVLVDVTVSADVAVDTGRQTEGHRREESSAQRAKYPR